MILENVLGDKKFVSSWHCIVFVGADLSAHGLLFVRMNSHLQGRQLHFSK